MTPSKARKLAEREAEHWETKLRKELGMDSWTPEAEKEKGQADSCVEFSDFVREVWFPLCIENGEYKAKTVSFYNDTAKNIANYFEGYSLQEVAHPGHWPGSHSILPPPPSPFFHAPHHRPHYLPYRPYFYDPVHFHAGWRPVYRPYYPWWIVDAATFGAGYAIGYYVRNGEPVYYYYPDETVVDAEPAPAEDVILEEIPLPEETGALAEPEITEAADNSGSVLDESILTPVEGGGQSVIENGGTEAVSALPKVSRSEIDSAWLKIQDGDTAFSKGEMTEAIEKYSQVSEDLPSIPDSWFRLAYAESARGNYGVASEYAVKGMEASKIWPASPFSMDYVYQGANDRKRTNLVALETAARNAPNDGPLNFLAGLSFYSDGQNDKAAKYFKIAEKNSPELKEFTEPMLNEIP